MNHQPGDVVHVQTSTYWGPQQGDGYGVVLRHVPARTRGRISLPEEYLVAPMNERGEYDTTDGVSVDPGRIAPTGRRACELRVKLPDGSPGTMSVGHTGDGWIGATLTWDGGSATDPQALRIVPRLDSPRSGRAGDCWEPASTLLGLDWQAAAHRGRAARPENDALAWEPDGARIAAWIGAALDRDRVTRYAALRACRARMLAYRRGGRQ